MNLGIKERLLSQKGGVLREIYVNIRRRRKWRREGRKGETRACQVGVLCSMTHQLLKIFPKLHSVYRR